MIAGQIYDQLGGRFSTELPHPIEIAATAIAATTTPEAIDRAARARAGIGAGVSLSEVALNLNVGEPQHRNLYVHGRRPGPLGGDLDPELAPQVLHNAADARRESAGRARELRDREHRSPRPQLEVRADGGQPGGDLEPESVPHPTHRRGSFSRRRNDGPKRTELPAPIDLAHAHRPAVAIAKLRGRRDGVRP